jgi:hypothetical protein
MLAAIIFVIFLLLLLLHFLRRPSFLTEDELIRRREELAEQPMSTYNAKYFEIYKGMEFVPCIGCRINSRRVAMVITSQGFKCHDCNRGA